MEQFPPIMRTLTSWQNCSDEACRRQSDRLVPRADGIWSASAGQPQHPGRPAQPGDAKETQLENQISRRVPAICAQRVGGGHPRLFRAGSSFSLHAAGSSRSGGEENPVAEWLSTNRACTNVFTFCGRICLPSRTLITRLGFKASTRDVNPRYWQLIQEFKKLTGYGVIVNTSFNVRGEPMVCSSRRRLSLFHANRNGLPGNG